MDSWAELGDLRELPNDREAIKAALMEQLPDEKAGAIPVHAGILARFVHEMQAGEIVVYPSKSDRQVNIGRFTGDLDHVPDDPGDYPNQRKVEWLGSFPRNDFSQSALNEIGSALTLFRVKRHASEFLAKVGLAAAKTPSEPDEDEADDDTATLSVSQQAEETTGDFVVRRLMSKLSGHDFETFVAHVMECMGYTARVTQKSGDGGVDVIAHRDALGFEPPIVKVQCKRITSQSGSPEVNQLLGTLGEGNTGFSSTSAATAVRPMSWSATVPSCG